MLLHDDPDTEDCKLDLRNQIQTWSPLLEKHNMSSKIHVEEDNVKFGWFLKGCEPMLKTMLDTPLEGNNVESREAEMDHPHFNKFGM